MSEPSSSARAGHNLSFQGAKLQPGSHTLQASPRGCTTSSTSQRWHVCVCACAVLRATSLYLILVPQSDVWISFCFRQCAMLKTRRFPSLGLQCWTVWGFSFMRRSNLHSTRRCKKGLNFISCIDTAGHDYHTSFLYQNRTSSAHLGRVAFDKPYAGYSTRGENFALDIKLLLCVPWKCWPFQTTQGVAVDCCSVFIIVYVLPVYVLNVVC